MKMGGLSGFTVHVALEDKSPKTELGTDQGLRIRNPRQAQGCRRSWELRHSCIPDAPSSFLVVLFFLFLCVFALLLPLVCFLFALILVRSITLRGIWRMGL